MTIDLDTLTLAKGAHDTRQSGVCLLEAVAWWAGQAHTDSPPCVSPVLRTFGVRLNDVLPDDRRQALKPLIPLLPGTAGDGLDEVRSYMALDWLIRTYTPTWLELAGLTDEARSLRGLRRIVDLVAAEQAGPVVRAAAERAYAAGDAAGAAAGDAAWAAAGDAAWAAAGDAAGDAAGAAAWAAAGDALQPTVDTLQQSAIDLFIAMIQPGSEATK
jgi:hypothetical protein